MSPAAGPASPSDRVPAMMPASMLPHLLQASNGFPSPGVVAPMAARDSASKDAEITWYRGEFAAANAIIDALCNHLSLVNSGNGKNGSSPEYESVFRAIHVRRTNWIKVIHAQRYYPIFDILTELRKVLDAKKVKEGPNSGVFGGKVRVEEIPEVEKKQIPPVSMPAVVKCEEQEIETVKESVVVKSEEMETVKKEIVVECNGNGFHDTAAMIDEDSPDSEVTDVGSQEAQPTIEDMEVCDNHNDCNARREQIKITKGFVAKEPVKGHMVNVVKGLKMYEDVFTDSELSKLNQFVDEFRIAGQNGELLGETYILFNQMTKGNKREQLQLGIPIFGHIKDEAVSEEHRDEIEPIPTILRSVIDHLVQWHILPENRKPDGCIINFFDEGEFSQPYLKPPHLDQPLCTLLLSDSMLAFGRTLGGDSDGNYKGQLMLSVKQGSVLIMRNNSSDMARHAMCASPTKRVSLTFFRVRPDTHLYGQRQAQAYAPITETLTHWQPGVPTSGNMPNGNMEPMQKWGVLRAPLVMLAPMRPVIMSSPRMPANSGTGVFLPWTVGSRKPAKHLPPRAQRGRRLAIAAAETQHISDTMSDPGVDVPLL